MTYATEKQKAYIETLIKRWMTKPCEDQQERDILDAIILGTTNKNTWTTKDASKIIGILEWTLSVEDMMFYFLDNLEVAKMYGRSLYKTVAAMIELEKTGIEFENEHEYRKAMIETKQKLFPFLGSRRKIK